MLLGFTYAHWATGGRKIHPQPRNFNLGVLPIHIIADTTHQTHMKTKHSEFLTPRAPRHVSVAKSVHRTIIWGD